MKPYYEGIVIGVSAGGMQALPKILCELPKEYPLLVMIVQHRLHNPDTVPVQYLNDLCDIQAKEGESGEVIITPCVYIAPSGYHRQLMHFCAK